MARITQQHLLDRLDPGVSPPPRRRHNRPSLRRRLLSRPHHHRRGPHPLWVHDDLPLQGVLADHARPGLLHRHRQRLPLHPLGRNLATVLFDQEGPGQRPGRVGLEFRRRHLPHRLPPLGAADRLRLGHARPGLHLVRHRMVLGAGHEASRHAQTETPPGRQVRLLGAAVRAVLRGHVLRLPGLLRPGLLRPKLCDPEKDRGGEPGLLLTSHAQRREHTGTNRAEFPRRPRGPVERVDPVLHDDGHPGPDMDWDRQPRRHHRVRAVLRLLLGWLRVHAPRGDRHVDRRHAQDRHEDGPVFLHQCVRIARRHPRVRRHPGQRKQLAGRSAVQRCRYRRDRTATAVGQGFCRRLELDEEVVRRYSCRFRQRGQERSICRLIF